MITMETRMMEPIHSKVYGDIINPDIPNGPREKRRFLKRCLGAQAYGYTLEGVTPRHVTPDGIYALNLQSRQLDPTQVQSGL